MLGIADGVQRAVRAMRAANPDVTIVHVEASSLFSAEAGGTTPQPELASEAALLNELGTVPTDLVLGRVGPGHRSYDWLVRHGAAPAALAALVDGAVVIDLLGVNYYPDLTPRSLVPTEDGTEQHAYDRWAEGLETALRSFGERYGLPMLVTETSIEGDDALRAAWVRDSAAVVGSLRDDGLDIRGWTWWPVFDFVDWSYASGAGTSRSSPSPPNWSPRGRRRRRRSRTCDGWGSCASRRRRTATSCGSGRPPRRRTSPWPRPRPLGRRAGARWYRVTGPPEPVDGSAGAGRRTGGAVPAGTAPPVRQGVASVRGVPQRVQGGHVVGRQDEVHVGVLRDA
ncbi:hypothetical protein P9139_04855 [Curtobacterium flaccumfaciens]|nr:hypothetical protein P9139_04855 [Curtobacterium flaccumfaciens]